jgi:hypothetical protein
MCQGEKCTEPVPCGGCERGRNEGLKTAREPRSTTHVTAHPELNAELRQFIALERRQADGA